MNKSKYLKVIHRLFSVIPILFGMLTILVGASVIAGSDPGYKVFFPLLVYNTVMGLGYILAGIIAWRNLKLGKFAAAIILILNLFVLITIFYIYNSVNDVAIESIRAMIFRTVVWLFLFAGLTWLVNRNKQIHP